MELELLSSSALLSQALRHRDGGRVADSASVRRAPFLANAAKEGKPQYCLNGLSCEGINERKDGRVLSHMWLQMG